MQYGNASNASNAGNGMKNSKGLSYDMIFCADN